jgi:hypothetical protein
MNPSRPPIHQIEDSMRPTWMAHDSGIVAKTIFASPEALISFLAIRSPRTCWTSPPVRATSPFHSLVRALSSPASTSPNLLQARDRATAEDSGRRPEVPSQAQFPNNKEGEPR